jgi:hypothetical protein
VFGMTEGILIKAKEYCKWELQPTSHEDICEGHPIQNHFQTHSSYTLQKGSHCRKQNSS